MSLRRGANCGRIASFRARKDAPRRVGRETADVHVPGAFPLPPRISQAATRHRQHFTASNRAAGPIYQVLFLFILSLICFIAVVKDGWTE